MPSISLGISDTELAAIKQVLSPQQYKQANYQATKRATRRGRVMMGDVVRARLTIRKKFIDAPTSKDAAIKDAFDRSTQTGRITTKRIGVKLAEFDYTASNTGGVTVRVDTSRAAIQIRHGFRARVKSASQNAAFFSLHVGIFVRKKVTGGGSARSKSVAYAFENKLFNAKGIAWRLPIEERYGPAVYDLVSKDDVLRPTLGKLHEMYRQEWGNQISRFTGGRITTIAALPIESGDTDN